MEQTWFLNIMNLNWFERSQIQQLNVSRFLEFAPLADSFYNVFYLVQSSSINEVRRNGKHEQPHFRSLVLTIILLYLMSSYISWCYRNWIRLKDRVTKNSVSVTGQKQISRKDDGAEQQ